MNKVVREMLAIFVVLSILSFMVYRACKPVTKSTVVYPQEYIDSVVNEANKANELAEYYAREYNKQGAELDSLKHIGVKTITRYRTVKEKGDTVTILYTCDSLANEYDEYIQATDRMMATVDSMIINYRAEIRALRGLDSVKTIVISDLQVENKKILNLAKRRGRFIEW